jgi:hypothetical protein
MKSMTMRERMLAVIQGRPHDRVPFVQYHNIAAPDDVIWEAVGRDNMGILMWRGLHAVDTPNCRIERQDAPIDGKKGFRQTLITPEGALEEERYIEPTFGTTAVRRHFVEDIEDYRILNAYFRDMQVRPFPDGFLNAVEELGEQGLPHVNLGRSPFQQLWIQWVGIQDLGVHMLMNPEVVAETFQILFDVQDRIFEAACSVVREWSVPHVSIADNITAPMIGEPLFREYCLPSYQRLADMLADTGKDVPIFVHMDGDLKPLWEVIGESPVRGLDSMSPPPDNDTSVADAVRLWPDMRLWINYPSSMHLRPAEEVYQAAGDLLEQSGRTGRLQIQISENVPPEVWRTSFPAIIRAINEYGPAGQ